MAPHPTPTPSDNMPPSTIGEYIAVISRLMAEKDRLITEKDDLVASKDRLWREMYQMLQEKDQKIRERDQEVRDSVMSDTDIFRPSDDALEVRKLRDQVQKLQSRNMDLEEALREALETGEDEGEDASQEDDNVFATSHEQFNRTSSYVFPKPCFSKSATDNQQARTCEIVFERFCNARQLTSL